MFWRSLELLILNLTADSVYITLIHFVILCFCDIALSLHYPPFLSSEGFLFHYRPLSVAVFPKGKVEHSVLNMVRKLIYLFSCVYSVPLFSSPLRTSSSLSSYTFSAVPDLWWGGSLRCQCCRVQHKECQQQLHSECSHACAQAHTYTHPNRLDFRGEITVSKNHSNNGNMVVGFLVNMEYYWRLFCPCMFLFSCVLSVWADTGIFMAWRDCFEDNAPRTNSVF